MIQFAIMACMMLNRKMGDTWSWTSPSPIRSYNTAGAAVGISALSAPAQQKISEHRVRYASESASPEGVSSRRCRYRWPPSCCLYLPLALF
eukprot:762720-Hanusia_phi.AAC.4